MDIYVRNVDRKRTYPIERFRLLRTVEKLHAEGSWVLEIDGWSPAVEALRQAGSGIDVRDEFGRLLYSGLCTSEEVRSSGGSTTITFSGPDDNVWLARRQALPQPLVADPAAWTESHAVYTGHLNAVLTVLVSQNMGSAALEERRVPGLVLPQAMAAAGPVVELHARLKPVVELIAQACAGSHIVAWIRPVENDLAFQVLDKTKINSSVLFSPDLGGVQYDFQRAAPTVTTVYVAGAGVLENRTIRRVDAVPTNDEPVRYYDSASVVTDIEAATTLAGVETAADSISGAYGTNFDLRPIAGSVVNDDGDTVDYDVVTESDLDAVKTAAKVFVEELAKYPQDFVLNSGLGNIELAKNMQIPVQDASAIPIPSFVQDGTHIYLDVSPSDIADVENWMRRAFHVEFAHVVDLTDPLRSDRQTDWIEYNPAGFTYSTSLPPSGLEHPPSFASDWARRSIYEDFAETHAVMITDDIGGVPGYQSAVTWLDDDVDLAMKVKLVRQTLARWGSSVGDQNFYRNAVVGAPVEANTSPVEWPWRFEETYDQRSEASPGSLSEAGESYLDEHGPVRSLKLDSSAAGWVARVDFDIGDRVPVVVDGVRFVEQVRVIEITYEPGKDPKTIVTIGPEQNPGPLGLFAMGRRLRTRMNNMEAQ